MSDFLTATIKTEDGVTVGLLVLAPKTFSSGKAGYFGQAKLELDGQRYQTQCQLVKITPKDAKE